MCQVITAANLKKTEHINIFENYFVQMHFLIFTQINNCTLQKNTRRMKISSSKAQLSITKRVLLDYIKFKTNNNFKFFAGNEYIADVLDLTKKLSQNICQ